MKMSVSIKSVPDISDTRNESFIFGDGRSSLQYHMKCI